MPFLSICHSLCHWTLITYRANGQPRQLVQGEISSILNAPAVKPGDAQSFEDFALSVGSLVRLLDTLEGAAKTELLCSSHVDRLLTTCPPHTEMALQNIGILQSGTDKTYTLPDFAEWLERKSQAIQISRRAIEPYQADRSHAERREVRNVKPQKSQSTIYYGTDQTTSTSSNSSHPKKKEPPKSKKRERFKPYFPFCNCSEHYLSSCTDFSKAQIKCLGKGHQTKRTSA